MRAVAARRAARAVVAVIARRLRRRFPADAEAALVEVFDRSQAEAVTRHGWRGLLRCWAAEAASLARLAVARSPMAVAPSADPDSVGSSLLGCFWHDLRDARRALWRTPGYTLVVALTLALGIGANTAIFSIVDALLFKPLPYANPDRLVLVMERHPSGGRNTVAPANFLDWRREATGFEALEARHASNVSLALAGNGPPVDVRGARVTAGYFDLLGIRAARGRVFQPGDDAPGAACTAVITHRLWISRFGGDPAAVGRTVRFSASPCTLVGVLPAGSVFERAVADAYTPLVIDPAQATRLSHFLTVLGRLGPQTSLQQAREEMSALAAAIRRRQTATTLEWGASVDPMRDIIVRADARRLVWVLFGAVAVVLVVACANVAGLGLARGAWRRREIAVRVSLGASRWRVVRHLIVESLLLATVGAGLGWIAGAWLLRAADTLVPSGALPPEAMAALDGRALAFTGFVAVITALLSGLLPAWQGTRVNVSGGLREAGRGGSAAPGLRRLQSGLLVVEVALATVLVAAATLLVVSFARLTHVSPGFSPDRVLAFRTSLPSDRYTSGAQVAGFYERAIDAIGHVGGVESVGAITSLPLGGWLYGTTFSVEGEPFDPEHPPAAHIQHAVGDYLATLGIPVVEGRAFNASDTATAEPVVMVNQTFVARYMGGGAAVGRRIHLSSPEAPAATVVGVIRNVKTESLSDGDLEIPEIYVPHAQSPMPSMFVAVRTRTADPLAVLPDVQAVVAALDPDLPLAAPQPLAEWIGRSVMLERFQMTVMSAFGALALLLACLGVYALRSQVVATRRRELGIRVALGATRPQVIGLVLGQGARLVLLGLAIGLVGAVASGRAIERWLFDTPASDLSGLGGAALVLGAAAMLASWLPARRASRVDPVDVLRADA